MISFPPWLEPHCQQLQNLIERHQVPQALLITGPAGTGRRILGLWLVARLLGLDDVELSSALVLGDRLEQDLMPAHPDLLVIEPPPEKRSILIDQVRELISFLQLTSHQKGAKVALVTPAGAMTSEAANSLLKTLEEPPGATYIVLITDSASHLRPTIVSRCHRLRIAVPPADQAMSWLNHQAPDVDWAPVLDLAGGAPLYALQLQDRGFLPQAKQFEADILALQKRRTSPAAIAKKWAKQDVNLCLSWLYQRVSAEIRLAVTGKTRQLSSNSSARRLQNHEKPLNISSLFACLSELNELHRLQRATLNEELNLTDLLAVWYGRD